MLTPAEVDLIAWRKGTFESKVAFWKDAAHTEKYPVSSYTVRMVVAGAMTLTIGAGLTVINENELIIKLSPTQTNEMLEQQRAQYHIEFEAAGEVIFPIRGLITFESP